MCSSDLFALLTFLLALGNSAAFLTGPHRHSRALALRASYTDAEKEKAISDTSAWCLDQCIKRGDCAVFEDLASMSTTQVQDFCKACVMGEITSNEDCSVEWMFAEDAPWSDKPKPAQFPSP